MHRGNESENPEQELIWPREALTRRESANKALSGVSLLAGLPLDTWLPSHLHRVPG